MLIPVFFLKKVLSRKSEQYPSFQLLDTLIHRGRREIYCLPQLCIFTPSYGPFLEAFQQADLGDVSDLLSESTLLDPEEQGRFLCRVLQALRTLTHAAPLLLTIDDLQWANSATLRLFGFLATRLDNLPVMLIGTVQRAEALPALQRLVIYGRHRGDVHLVSLSPLTAEDVTRLIQSLGISPASATTFAQWVYERSGGSPFILKEILAQLQAEAILTPVSTTLRLDVGRWLRRRTTLPLPETTHELVCWRLANLSPQARLLLDLLAVANQALCFALLREFAGVQDEQLLPTIEELVVNGLVVEVANLATDGLQIPAVTLTDAPLTLSGGHLRNWCRSLLLACGASCELHDIYEISGKDEVRQKPSFSAKGSGSFESRRPG